MPTQKQLKTARANGGRFVASEYQDRYNLIKWLKLAYPNVLFKVSFGDDAKLDGRQAKQQKNLSCGRGWPDIMIYEPRRDAHLVFYGLAIELKKADERIFYAPGVYMNEHLEEQANMLEKLKQRGWWAQFAKGFDNARQTIEHYLQLSSV